MSGDAISNLWRMFLALNVPEDVREQIEKAQLKLRAAFPRSVVRWTSPEQFHLTLKFLGGVATNRVAELETALTRAVSGINAFHVSADGIGFFPNLRRARVIWAGVTSPRTELTNLFHAVQKGTAEFSKEEVEEQFVGHVTLGRVKILKRDDTAQLGCLASDLTRGHFGKWIVEDVDIMRSELSASGAVHTVHARIPLNPLAL